MENPSPTTMVSVPEDTQQNTISDWAGHSLGLSCDKFGDMSWMPFDQASGQFPAPLSATDQAFSMDLCQQQYDMPLQPYDTMQFGTLVPADLSNNAAIDDAASSIHSWPNSPSSLPGSFSDAVTASTHTSPEDLDLDLASSRRHSFQQPHSKSKQQQHKAKLEAVREKRRNTVCFSSSRSSAAAKSEAPTATGSGTKSKKKTIREKNRTAATKYRNKTKKGIEELQETESQLAEKNSILSAHVDCLRNEILSLKTEILRHGTCESPIIQEYIMKTAKQL